MTTRDLNQQVSFYRLGNTPDNYGGSIPMEDEYWTTHAKVEQKTSRKENEAGETEYKQGFEITVRYRRDKAVLVGDFVKYRGQDLVIYYINPDRIFKDYLQIKGVLTSLNT